MNSRASVIGILWLSGLFFTILLLNSVSVAGDIENLVSNPDFDIGTNGWKLNTGGNSAGELKTEKVRPAVGGAQRDCLYAKIDAVGPNAWNPEVHSPSFEVEKGKTYTVSLWAKTEKGSSRTIGVKFEQLDTWVGPSQKFTLSDEWTEYHFSPVMTMGSPPAVVIHIQFDLMKDDVWFDHFRVYQGEYVAEDISPKLAIKPIGKLGTTWGVIKSK